MSSSDYVVVQRRSPTPFLMLILIIMNAISIFISFSYYQKVVQLEDRIRSLEYATRLLNSNVQELAQSYKPVAVTFDYYVKFMMARILSEMYGISLEDAMSIIERYSNATGFR